MKHANIEHIASLSKTDKLAMWVTSHVGAPGFFVIIILWTVLWLAWNATCPGNYCFDRPFEFAVWLFISNMIQLFLMPLILIGQQLQSRHSETRAEVDHENLQKIVKHLEEIKEKLQ